MLRATTRAIVLNAARGRPGLRLLHVAQPRWKIRPFRMPAQCSHGESAKLGEWVVKEGGQFHAGDMLVEVETDKVFYKHEAERDGVLAKIIHPAGSSVPEGTVIALLADKGDNIANIDSAAYPFPDSEGRLKTFMHAGFDPTRPAAPLPQASRMFGGVTPRPSVTELRVERGCSDREQGVLGAWLIEEGASFRAGEILAEIEADKHIYLVIAEIDGVLQKVLRQRGEPVPVGTVLAQLSHDVPNIHNPPYYGHDHHTLPYNAFLS